MENWKASRRKAGRDRGVARLGNAVDGEIPAEADKTSPQLIYCAVLELHRRSLGRMFAQPTSLKVYNTSCRLVLIRPLPLKLQSCPISPQRRFVPCAESFIPRICGATLGPASTKVVGLPDKI